MTKWWDADLLCQQEEFVATDTGPILYGIPANKGHDTAPFESLIYKFAQSNAAALYLAANGVELDATATITTGHKHSDFDSQIWWRQVGSWRFNEESNISDKTGHEVSVTTSTDFAFIPIRFPLDVSSVPINTRLIPRLRVSLPKAGTATHSTLTVTGLFYRPNGSDVLSTAVGVDTTMVFTLTSLAGSTYSDVWIEGADLKFTAADITSAGGNVYCLLAAKVDTGGAKATVWEFSLGYVEG